MRDYRVIVGNLLDAPEGFICHQVNCQGKMGSGVAKAIREKHPILYEGYVKYVDKARAKGEELLGSNVLHYTNIDGLGDTKYIGIINMFAQDRYGYDGKQYTSLSAFRSCLKNINAFCKGQVVSFPWKIACVRGGADWDVVLPMILEELTDVKEIVFYRLEG